MNRFDIDINVSAVSADASSILVLAGEACEEAEPNSNLYFKLHAIYTIAENMISKLDQIGDDLAKLQN